MEATCETVRRKGGVEGPVRARLAAQVWSAVNSDHYCSYQSHQGPQQLSVSATVHEGAHLHFPVSLP